jgi:hypothetical protein
VPALNELLAPHGITLGERILQGSTSLGKHTLQVGVSRGMARHRLESWQRGDYER